MGGCEGILGDWDWSWVMGMIGSDWGWLHYLVMPIFISLLSVEIRSLTDFLFTGVNGIDYAWDG